MRPDQEPDGRSGHGASILARVARFAPEGWAGDRQATVPVAVLVLLACAAAWGIQSKVSADREMALSAYRTQNAELTHKAVDRISEKLRQVHQNLRTISLLPSVRELDRHGDNLSESSLITIQQVYNNLASNVDISEVYVVPVTFKPDRIDPVTRKFEEPTLMFDELIVDAGQRTGEAEGLDSKLAEEPEVEMLEYAVLRRQLDWLSEYHPDTSRFSGLDRPMLTSEEVITCDNTLYVKTGRDSDRSGIMLSVPFYGVDGKLKGIVSAIIRSTALAGYLPEANGVLLNRAHNYAVFTRDSSLADGSRAHVLGGTPDPDLLFSIVDKVDVADPQGEWLYWSGLPNVRFEQSAEVRSIGAFQMTAYAILALIMSGLLAAIIFVTSRVRAQRVRQQQLRQEVEMREAQIEVLERAKAETLEARKAAEKARVIAEEASRAKSQFLANMSHEIRTPLNGVLGIAQALRADLQREQQEKIDLILESGRSLTYLLGDILDLSKIEAGKLEIVPAAGDFIQSINRVWTLYKLQAESKGLDYRLHLPPDFPRYLTYDDHRVRQCVGNLLSNAVKFTAKGHIAVSLVSRPAADGQHVVAVQVSDTGIGLSEDALGRLFQPFSQVDDSTTRKFGGTGLGLSISKKLARLMGGDVRVRSETGRGSSFSLVLRTAEAPAPIAAAPVKDVAPLPDTSAKSLRGLRVLLTDDNALNRKVVRLLLAPYACEVTEAGNGKEALEALSRQPFDVLLLDAHMPVMDGPQTIRAIRASAEAWKDLPVIALTADAMAGDRDKYLALGMNDYLTKPVDKGELVAKMSALLGNGTAPSEAARAAG